MMYLAWSSIEEVPYYYLSWSSVKFKDYRGQKIADFDPNWAFVDCNSIWLKDGYKIMHLAWSSIEELFYFFSRSSDEFQGHAGQKLAKLGVSGL